MISTVAGDGISRLLDGFGTQASFYFPHSVVASGPDSAIILFVADFYNAAIRKINSTNYVSTLAGGVPGFADGVGTDASFSQPSYIRFNPIDGMLIVTDFSNSAIRQVDPNTGNNTSSSSIIFASL